MKVNPCVKCGLRDSGEKWAHDPCIANMQGVVFACCGHGNPAMTYFKFAFGPTIRGTQKIAKLLAGIDCDGKRCSGPAKAREIGGKSLK